MFISPDANGSESATGISRALGMAPIGWKQSGDTMSDWVVESMQEIVGELKKEQRRFFLYRCPHRQPWNTERDLQATSCSKTSGSGFHLQIRGRIIPSPVNLGTAERGHGGLKVTPMRNGSVLVQAHCYGFMENVRISLCIPSCKLMVTASSAGAGKSVIWSASLNSSCSRAYSVC